MSHPFSYPAWLEAHVIDDAHVAAAYEAVSPDQRATLKKTLARLHLIWGEQPAVRECTRTFSQGFAVREQCQPAPFALFFVQGNYPHPACLLAALMPAILAGVPQILPCFVPGSGQTGKSSPGRDAMRRGVRPASAFAGKASGALPAPELLAALDIAGIERAFAMTEESTRDLLPELVENLGLGRLVRLGLERSGDGLAAFALQRSVPFMDLAGLPTYLAQEEVVYLPPAPEEGSPLLTLDREHADAWVWPQLSPDWFCVRRMHVFGT